MSLEGVGTSLGQTASAVLSDPAMQSRIHTLRDALRNHDLAALDEWEAVAAQCVSAWGAERQLVMQQHVDALEFDAALQILNEMIPPSAG